MDLQRIGKNIKLMFTKDSNHMKNLLIFACYSIKLKIKTNNNQIKKAANRFNLKQPEEKLNFSKGNQQMFKGIQISRQIIWLWLCKKSEIS